MDVTALRTASRFAPAVVVACLVSLIYAFYAGIVTPAIAPHVAVTAVSLSGMLYFVFVHDFGSHRSIRAGTYLTLGLLTITPILGHVDPLAVFPPLSLPGGDPAPQGTFLPDWWLLGAVVPSIALIVLDSLTGYERPAYPTPSHWEDVPSSPVYFGGLVAILGFWGVLFVGFGLVHRIIIVAPIFEELLKFGLALFISASLFGRSLGSRIAIALIVGLSFGLIEHTITYPGELDAVYLFRVCFHMLLTALSITVYTTFERHGSPALLWTAPITAMFLHFTHNTLAVVSGIALYGAPDSIRQTVPVLTGSAITVTSVVLLGLAARNHPGIGWLHRAIRSFLDF